MGSKPILFKFALCAAFMGYFHDASGQCPKFPMMKNFDVDKIQGTWHGFQQSINGPDNLTCIHMSLNKTNPQVLTANITVTVDGVPASTIETFKVSSDGSPMMAESIGNDTTSSATVIEADYDSYFVFVACSEYHSTYETKSQYTVIAVVRNSTVAKQEKLGSKIKEVLIKSKVPGEMADIKNDCE